MANFTNATLQNLTQNVTSAVVQAGQDVASHAGPGFFGGVGLIFVRLWDIVTAPFLYGHMQWILIPLILTFMLMEFYFFRHPDEELGWNAALINSLVLVFVAIDLTKTLFAGETPWQLLKEFGHSLTSGEQLSAFLVIIFIGGLGLALMMINYFHLLPRKIAYQLSSHGPINFIAFFAIVVVYRAQAGEPLPLDGYTVVAAVLLFTILMAAMFSLQRLIGSKDLSMYARS